MRAVWIQAVFLLLTACGSTFNGFIIEARAKESDLTRAGNLRFYTESKISKAMLIKGTTILDAKRKNRLSNNNTGPITANLPHRIVKRNASETQPTTVRPPTFILPPVTPPPPTFILPPPPVFTLPPPPVFTLPPPPVFTLQPPIISPVCLQPENSCSGRCTTGNRTEWRTELKLACSCDSDCYEVFNDCCADYENYCGGQNSPQNLTQKYNWTCARVGNYDLKLCVIGDGIWMVTQCAEDWPNDDTRTKCESPVTQLTLSSPDLRRYLPVLSRGNATFRNLYCALCNRVEEPYESWPVDIETSVIPPANYNLTEKIQFLLSHGAEFPDNDGPWRPKSSQPRRYCLRPDKVDDSCDKSGFSCEDGPTAIVSVAGYKYFKNIQCAACQGVPGQSLSCFPSKVPGHCQRLVPQSFSLVLDYQRGIDHSREESKFSVKEQACGDQGMIYDDVLEVCRVNWLHPPDQNGQARFYVVAWLAPKQVSKNIDFSPGDFQKSLGNYFNVSTTQILDTNISAIPNPADNTLNSFYLLSSTIILTPEQSLELLSGNRDTHNASKPRLLDFIYFKEPLSMVIIRNTSYTIVKTTSRPLTCAGKTVYSPTEYTMLDQDKVHIDSTNITYERSQYFRENSPQPNTTLGNITICKKYIPTGCNATWTILTPQQFTITANLSVYHKKTSALYHYGQYDTFSNNSVAVCISVYTTPTGTIESIWGDVVLAWISFFGFLLSALFLIFLLVTYILFAQLRTLPGKNLMNLATSLLMFSFVWMLISFDNVRSVQPLCTAMAVIAHYLLLAYFSSMAMIAFHTCKVFARQLPALKTSKGYERKLFGVYVFLVWLLPALLVMTCFICDKKQVMHVGYGDNEVCWIQDKDSYTYLVTIPIALLLLFNTVAFITSAVYLRKHSQNRAAIAASGTRTSNLSIYVKLSTLMGFTWLFGFLAVIAEPSEVFWYLFMILTPLQGVFVTVAFVANAKTFRMYKNTSRKLKGQKNNTVPNTTNRKLATNTFENTRL